MNISEHNNTTPGAGKGPKGGSGIPVWEAKIVILARGLWASEHSNTTAGLPYVVPRDSSNSCHCATDRGSGTRETRSPTELFFMLHVTTLGLPQRAARLRSLHPRRKIERTLLASWFLLEEVVRRFSVAALPLVGAGRTVGLGHSSA